MIRTSTAVRALLVPSQLSLQKKTQVTSNAYLAGASKTGSEEKWAQAAMEYIYEKNHVNDSRKRAADIAAEQRMADAYDRLSRVNARHFDRRLSRLVHRMNESLEAIAALGLQDCLEEAVVLQSEQPPGNYRRPTLTPPVPGYDPGFGLDVPQLKSLQAEYPAVVRPTDSIQYGTNDSPSSSSSSLVFEEEEEGEQSCEGGSAIALGEDADAGAAVAASYFPFVDAHAVEDLTAQCSDELERIHGEIRAASPLTGVEGEGWEAYVALQKKALARQSLIFALANDPEFKERYDKDTAVRNAEWFRRGMLPLTVEPEEERDTTGMETRLAGGEGEEEGENWASRTRPPRCHYAQTPAYQPIRSS